MCEDLLIIKHKSTFSHIKLLNIFACLTKIRRRELVRIIDNSSRFIVLVQCRAVSFSESCSKFFMFELHITSKSALGYAD